MTNPYQLTASAVDSYETQKVRSIFEPLAKTTLKTVDIAEGSCVLDVACGTGIVARTIRDFCGPSVAIVGVDCNDLMIAKARTMVVDLPGDFDWHVCDVTDIPCPNGKFTYVFCQQGIQYFPDDLKALAEMRRILAADGKLVLTVWEPANEYFLAQSAAMEKFISTEAAEKALAPFVYPGETRLPELLAHLGFAEVATTRVSIERVIPDAKNGIRDDILGSPLGPMVDDKGHSLIVDVVEDILSTCAGCLKDNNLVVLQHSTLIVASGWQRGT